MKVTAGSAENRALLPTEADFKGRPGYWQKPAKVRRPGVGMVDGYEWGYSFKPNEGGKLTRRAGEVGEMLRPFARAETARQTKVEIRVSRPTFGYSRTYSEAKYWKRRKYHGAYES